VEKSQVLEVIRCTGGQEEEETFKVRGPHALTDEYMATVITAALANETEGIDSTSISSSSSSNNNTDGARAGEEEEEEGDGVSELGINEEDEW
jgi:hypothetical protein